MISFLRLTLIVLTSLLGGFSSQSTAHDLGLAQVTVSKASDGTTILLSKLSATISAQAPILPDTCAGETKTLTAPDRLNQRLETRMRCTGTANGQEILMPWQVDGIFLISQVAGQQSDVRFIPAGPGGVALKVEDLNFQAQGTLDIIVLYAQLGIKHILIGLDHLALLLCLALLAKGVVLVRLVTAFTIGHSITLCLAALQIVRIPVAPVEVLIVLSVAYLARDVWLGRQMDRNSTLLLVGIGMLHGLGFASVLNEIGLPQSDLLFALLSFNIGIEIGQLAFLIIAVIVFGLIGRIAPIALQKPMPIFGSFLIGSLAMYWTFERIGGFFV